MIYNPKKPGGLLLFVGGVQWILAVIVAEARYQSYSVAQNFLSDLGVDHCSAFIFNGSTFLLGLLVIAATYLLRNEFGSRFFTFSLLLGGVGSLGVGIFNETHILIHSIFAIMAFVFGAATAIAASRRVLKPPLSYFSIALGAFSLLAFILFLLGFQLVIGEGGIERMIVYPNTMGLVGLGGYLMASSLPPAASKTLVA